MYHVHDRGVLVLLEYKHYILRATMGIGET